VVADSLDLGPANSSQWKFRLLLAASHRRISERGMGVAMPKQPRRLIKNHPLGVSIAAALAVKAVALTALYLAFFVPPPNPIPPSERAATAVLGLPAVKP
jgi:hypothetical protein